MDELNFQDWADERGSGWDDLVCMISAFAVYDQINEKRKLTESLEKKVNSTNKSDSPVIISKMNLDQIIRTLPLLLPEQLEILAEEVRIQLMENHFQHHPDLVFQEYLNQQGKDVQIDDWTKLFSTHPRQHKQPLEDYFDELIRHF